MDFQKVLETRASVRKYSLRKPALHDVIQAIQAANTAPFTGNLQVLRYVVVENPETISKIADACQQEFIKQAPYVVVVCSDIIQLKRLYDERSDRYLRHNAGVAIENFLLKVVDLGMASCWVGAFSEPTLRNLLVIPDEIEIEAVLPVGYEEIKGRAKQKYKHNLINKVFSEIYNRKYKSFIKVRRTDI